ncbi:hypothetical protein [Glaciihabitans sp. dw_435]|uniref:hypothetical protein n=1 Tax=Glaciihabitans sp. dw_435 TaxID=2720081 RepID=UPI001BD4E10F|nr:hypothetical protein [Glaciihabitans sp. dw_435]
MSYQVELSSSDRPLLSETPGPEPRLHATNLPPLLWWALFAPGDVVQTDPHGAALPYLMIDQVTGLCRLRRRRECFIAMIGADIAEPYDGFTDLIERDFAPYITVRSVGLRDATRLRPHLERTLDDLEMLDELGAPAADGPLLRVAAHASARGA